MRILALDPATKCGWALDFEGNSGTWDFKARRDESAGIRTLRLHKKLSDIHKEQTIDVLVFEAARNAAPGMQGALTAQAELQGVIKCFCEDNKIKYAGYSPGKIKKSATGKGTSNKSAMVKAAEKKWPHLKISGDDEADALHLLCLAHKDFVS